MATAWKVFTLQEAASHNNLKDCWLVMFGKVYDVTEFMDDHPGVGDVMVASVDATEDFEDVGHSKAAIEQLEKYCIGEIDASTLSKKNNTAPRLNQTSRDNSGGDFMIKILRFLVPLMILALALLGSCYTKKQDPSL